jgi:uncharacterized cupin superfamily protein
MSLDPHLIKSDRLEWEGTLRPAGSEHPLAAGDYVALTTGPDGAHQVVNTSSRPLRYLCLSTMIEPEVAVYPDSWKVELFAGSPPGRRPAERDLRAFLRSEPRLGYWDGEA